MWGRPLSAPPRKAEDGHAASRFAEHQIRFGAGLAARRRESRRRAAIAFFILLLLLLAGVLYELNQPALRIAEIRMYGSDAGSASYAREAMRGSYLWLVPRDSFFFVPERKIRVALLADRPEIAAVSVSRSGLTSLSIRMVERTAVAKWCGLAPTEEVEEYCYAFDANGYIFAPATTSIKTVNEFSLYAPLVGDTPEPLRATISRADQLPSVFDLARELAMLGARADSVVLRDDEVDIYVKSGTRVTYVIGNEQNAFTALVSARADLDLSNGSIDYVDLRFDGKVYVKKR